MPDEVYAEETEGSAPRGNNWKTTLGNVIKEGSGTETRSREPVERGDRRKEKRPEQKKEILLAEEEW